MIDGNLWIIPEGLLETINVMPPFSTVHIQEVQKIDEEFGAYRISIVGLSMHVASPGLYKTGTCSTALVRK